LRGTPLPPWAYVVAVIASTLLVYAIEAVCLILLGRLLFDVPFPDRWLSVVLTLLLGGLTFAALGLGLTGVIRSAEGSSAVVNAVYLPMAFISGSFFSTTAFPPVVEAIAEVLPLTYFIELTRDVLLKNEDIWSNGTAVAVIVAWGIAGTVAALRWFRWEPQEG
jgi:ABC-2 type transport system permease protein